MKLNRINRNKKYIYNDEQIDAHNWKFSVDTDGVNQISRSRKKFYSHAIPPFQSYKQHKRALSYAGIEHYVPSNVLKFLKEF